VGGGKGRIPWAKLQGARGDFILAKYLPNGVTLAQFHHLRLDDANALLKHWTQRQAAGEIPFRFKKFDKADQRGKRASADEDASAGMGSRPPNARKDQERGDDEEDQGDGEGSANEGPDGRGGGDATGNQRNVS
jgi:hypothetical protein